MALHRIYALRLPFQKTGTDAMDNKDPKDARIGLLVITITFALTVWAVWSVL